MKKVSLVSLVCGLGISFSAMASGTEIVQCTNDIGTDRQKIQDAVDNLSNNQVIIKGTCQLDGTSIQVTRDNLDIKGERTGPVGKASSYKTIINGVLDENGFPQGDSQSTGLFNRGIAVNGNNVTVRDLRMDGHNRTVSGDNITAETNLCIDQGESAPLANMVVKNSYFVNNVRGPQYFGGGQNITFMNNTQEGTLDAGHLLSGGSVGCFLLVGEPDAPEDVTVDIVDGICQNAGLIGTQPAAQPPVMRDVDGDGDLETTCFICDEDVDPLGDTDDQCDPTSDVSLGNLDGALIKNNHIDIAVVADGIGYIQQGTNSNVLIKANVFNNGITNAFLIGEEGENVVFEKNILSNGGALWPSFLKFGGMFVEGSGYLIQNNTYINNEWVPENVGEAGSDPVPADIILFTDGPNTIIESECTNIVDLGEDNTVIRKGDCD